MATKAIKTQTPATDINEKKEVTIRVDDTAMELVINSAMHDFITAAVDGVFTSTINDLYFIASLIDTDYGAVPTYEALGLAMEAAMCPSEHAFDRDVIDGEGNSMPYGEIKDRRDSGTKPLTSAQHEMLIEASSRALTGITNLKSMKTLGYQSQHTREDIWTSAMTRAKARNENYKLAQEAAEVRKRTRMTQANDRAAEHLDF